MRAESSWHVFARRRLRRSNARHARQALFVVCVCAMFAAGAPACGEPEWTTYHHDAARSGIDPESTQPLKPTRLWQTPALDGPIWAEPLVYGPDVYVATENDTIYAIDAETGKVAWEKHLGTPVPSSELPCGDIEPTVGITSTPVIDPQTSTIYAVEDTWDGTHQSSIRHKLIALDTQTGTLRANFPIEVDPAYPSGGSARNQLQRAALALDGNEIVIGYGGNDGDCQTYWGWLVAAPKSGVGPTYHFQVESETGHHAGAIWGSGNAPAVDSSGDVYAATGNGYSGGHFDYSESVLRLEPDLHLIEYWAPKEWLQLDEGDGDLGSSNPMILPNGLVFEIGKSGEGVLLRPGAFGGVGASPAASLSVCGSWGGGIYVPASAEGGTLYVSCLSGGLRAVAVSELGASKPKMSLAEGWSAPEEAIGPPIYAGGLVWATHWKEHLEEGGGVIYGIDPASGQVKFEENEGAFAHFATPSAGAGRLFLANGTQLTALRIAKPPPEPPPSEEHPSGRGPSTPSGSPKPSSPMALLVHRHLRTSAGGRRVKVTLRCPSKTTPCTGIVRLLLAERSPVNHHRSHHFKPVGIPVASARFGPIGGVFTVTLRLDASARSLLARHRGPRFMLLIEIKSDAGRLRTSVSLKGPA